MPSSLDQALANVTAAESTYNAAVAQTETDNNLVANAQDALTSAQAVVTTDQTNQKSAADAYNAALDALVTAAQAAKVTS